MATVFGIDVSHFQHGLSLTAVRRQGYGFVIAKATQGRTFQDPDFHTFREEAQDIGLPFAAYHFLHSDSAPAVQAENLAEHLNGHTEIPVMIDVEPTDGSSPNLDHVTRFVAACRRNGLRVTILYLPRFHWRSIGRPALGNGLPPLMQALYGGNKRGAGSALYPGNDSPRWAPMGGRTPTLLQFGSRGRIDGFARMRIDVDAFRGTPQDLAATGMLWTPGAKKGTAKKGTAKKVPGQRRAMRAETIRRDDDLAFTWRGRRLNAKTILMLQAAERRLGERFVITQGSFNNTVHASAGTHDRGGVVDISVRTKGPIRRKVRVLRRAGFAAWHRTPNQFKEPVPAHIHAVSLFDKNLSTGAKKQRDAYLATPALNGLANGGLDDGPAVAAPARPTLVRQTVRRREILLGATNESVGFLQDVLGLTPDNFFGPKETQRFTQDQFGWGGRKPMSEALFRRLFPEELFVLDASLPQQVVPAPVPAAPPAPVPGPAPVPVPPTVPV